MNTTLECLLAIDVGTSSLKATLFDLQGTALARESVGYSYSVPGPNQAEQDPEDWWRAGCTACSRLMASGRWRVLAVCVSGQAPGCVPIRRDGDHVRPAILWLDRRATAQAAWLKENLDLSAHPGVGLNTLDSYFGGVKWHWYRQVEPESYQATWKILQANGYLVYKLTGEAVTDPSHAGVCSPCFDFEQRGWADAVCSLMEIDPEKLPAIHPSTEIIGAVSAAAAAKTGLPAGTPVVCGAADFVCAHLGSGALEANSAALMLGTAGNLMSLAPQAADPRLLNTVHVNGSILSTGGVLAGGATAWFGEMLNIGLPDPLSVLDSEAAAVEPGAEKLLFLPYLMGERSPLWDAQARGVYFGLSPRHQRGHLYRALLEGVAHAFKQIADILASRGVAIEQVVAINGGARSTLWRQILADVLGVPIRWRPSSEGSAVGAAALAAVGAGVLNQVNEIRGWLEPTIDTLPDIGAHQVYVRQHEVFLKVYRDLKESFKVLQES